MVQIFRRIAERREERRQKRPEERRKGYIRLNGGKDIWPDNTLRYSIIRDETSEESGDTRSSEVVYTLQFLFPGGYGVFIPRRCEDLTTLDNSIQEIVGVVREYRECLDDPTIGARYGSDTGDKASGTGDDGDLSEQERAYVEAMVRRGI